MGLFANKEAYLGVDIGAHGIKIVELHKTKGRPQLWTYGIAQEELDIHLPKAMVKTPEDLLDEQGSTKSVKKKEEKKIPQLDDPRIDKYSVLLKALLKKAKITGNKATASLPVSYIFHTTLNMPKIDDKEIDHVVRAEVEKVLPRPLDEMQVVHQKIPSGGKEEKNLKILVTAAPKVLVQFYTAIFQKAGLVLQELETEAFALQRSLVGNDKATVMVVDIGAERTNFFIMDQSLPITHRSINAGGQTADKILSDVLGVGPELVEQVKKDAAKMDGVSSEIFGNLIDPIVKEIEYSFDLFLHQIGNEKKRPEKIILTGGTSVLPFIKEEIQKKFPVKVFVGDPWARTIYQDGLKQVLDEVGPRMAVSIGLAMRNIV